MATARLPPRTGVGWLDWANKAGAMKRLAMTKKLLVRDFFISPPLIRGFWSTQRIAEHQKPDERLFEPSLTGDLIMAYRLKRLETQKRVAGVKSATRFRTGFIKAL
jgi:hypothetical protein